jgi:hypothetical protein
MDRLDRIYGMHRILCAARRPVSRRQLAEHLECTESTVYRVSHALETHFGSCVKPWLRDCDEPRHYIDRNLVRSD